jgi:hypothetical protein
MMSGYPTASPPKNFFPSRAFSRVFLGVWAFFLKDPAIAGLRFSLLGRIFTEWSNDQGIMEKVIKRKTK